MPATKTTPESEFLGRWWLPWYNPRKHPMQIPAERWDEGECWCLSVNRKWGSHILGVLDLLDQWDTWIGTDDEIEAARIQVNEIKECFTRGTDMGCGCGGTPTPTNITFDENGGMLVSYDGGVTYEPAPEGLDPRYSGSIAPPITGANGASKRCQAAGSATEVMKDQQEQFANDAQMWSGISGATAALVTLLIFIGIIGSGGALTPLLLGLAAAMLAAGQAAFTAAFNDTVWGIVQCAIYCHTDSDAGVYSASDIAAIRADIAEQLGDGIAQVWIDKTLELWGGTGLTNASRAGLISLIDCSGCGCGTCTEVWDVGYELGNIISRGTDAGGDYIEIESVADAVEFGAYGWVLLAPDIDQCCTYATVTTVSGSDQITVLLNQCGEAFPSYGDSWPGYAGTEVNGVLLAAPAAGVYKLYLGA